MTKIVAIHSYSDDFPWTAMLTESYMNELKTAGIKFDLKNFYFDAKKNPFTGTSAHPLTASFISELKKIKPRLVFVTDDLALSQVGSFLTNEKIPFVFAGINGEIPSEILKSTFKSYTGVFERYYIVDTVKLIKRLLKKDSIKILIMIEDSETASFVSKYADQELRSMAGVKRDTMKSNSFADWQSKILDKSSNYDAFLPLQHFALKNSDGSYLPGPKVVEWLYQNSLKPVVYAGGWQIECGGAMSISIKPRAQGSYAGKLSIEVLKNKFPPPIIPPTGDIDINYVTTQKLGIKIPFDILTNARIIKSIQSPCNPK